jgi:hypothetical protein
MQKKMVVALILLGGIFLTVQQAMAISGSAIVALKKAGISDQTIEIIVEEKVIETAAFSVDEIANMKNAGLGEETIRMLVREGSFLKDAQPIVYGNRMKSLRFTSAQDVIDLKKAGLSDEVIQAIIAVSGERYDTQRAEAYDLLRSMGIIVNTHGDRGYRRGKH